MMTDRNLFVRGLRAVTVDFGTRSQVGSGIAGPIKRVTLDFSGRSRLQLAGHVVTNVTLRCVRQVKVGGARFFVTRRFSGRRPRIRVTFGHVSGGNGAVSSERRHLHDAHVYGRLALGCNLRVTNKGSGIGHGHLGRPSEAGCTLCSVVGVRINEYNG